MTRAASSHRPERSPHRSDPHRGKQLHACGQAGLAGDLQLLGPLRAGADVASRKPAAGHRDYAGDSHFAPSAGVASFTPISVVLFQGLRVSEVSAGGLADRIPLALTNTNPFAVSADEELTVVASAAKTQRIGHAKVELAPLRTVETKVRLRVRAGGC